MAHTKLTTLSSPERRDEVLLSLVRDEVATVLGYQDQDLPERPLADLGFDSSTSVLLSNCLRRMTGLNDIPITLAPDYEILPALVQYLSDRLGTEPGTEPHIKVSPSTADDIVDGLELRGSCADGVRDG